LDAEIERHPERYELRETRARLYAARGVSDDAAACWVELLDGQKPSRHWNSRRLFLSRDLASYPELFDSVLASCPNDATLWIGRAQHQVFKNRWAESLSSYRRANPLGEIDDVAFEYAAVHCLSGDEMEFHRICQQLGENSRTQNAYGLYNLARIGSIAPLSGFDPEQLVSWAKSGVAKSRPAWQLHALGLAYYRAGQLEDAIKTLEESNAGNWRPLSRVQNGFVLAMAHHRAGNQKESRKWLERSNQTLELERQTSDERLIARKVPVPDWIAIEVLRREAEALVEMNETETVEVTE
jgi:tetratricopeptide (TPR) repeat protein